LERRESNGRARPALAAARCWLTAMAGSHPARTAGQLPARRRHARRRCP
jgi:hypothetical protein